MTFTSAIVLTALAASSSVHAQQINPTDALNQATQTVAALPSASSPAADQIAALRQDFTDFASAYLAGPSTPVTGTPAAVGTTGRSEAAADWRTRYQRVEADLAALLGPVGGAASGAPSVVLDSDTRARLETVRSRLRTFYSATMSQPDGNPVAHTGTPQSSSNGAAAAAAPPVAPTGEAPQTTRAQAPAPGADAAPATGNRNPTVDAQWGTALAMLDRMERILNDATKASGKIDIDRGSIDEMRAEIAQIRAILRGAVKD